MSKNYNVFMPLCICLLASLNQKRASATDKKLVQAMEIKESTPVHEITDPHPSPIHIDTTRAIKMSFEQLPKIRYIDSDFLLINEEHTFSLVPQTNENYIILDNRRYDLKQCHFHVPVKHEIDGNFNHMELHIVHVNSNGDHTILGVFFQLGEENHMLQEAFGKSNQISQNQFLLTLKNNLRDLNPYKTKILRYEDFQNNREIQWILCGKPISLSSEQLNSFIEQFGCHSRISRPNAGPILYY